MDHRKLNGEIYTNGHKWCGNCGELKNGNLIRCDFCNRLLRVNRHYKAKRKDYIVQIG